MRVRLGPILHIDSPTTERWRFRVQFLLEGEGALDVAVTSPDEGVEVGPAARVASFPEVGPLACFSWPVSVERAAIERRISYQYSQGNATETISGIAVPAKGALPNFAFFTCNGFSSPDLMHDVDVPNALWERILERHTNPSAGEGGIHLLIGGGDQVYADSLLYSVQALRRVWDLSPRKRKQYTPSATFAKQVLDGYVRLYRERWGQEEFAEVVARVPAVFTWDDHDIFDGWGSYESELNNCPAYRTIFEQARRAFVAFQLGGTLPGATRPPLCSAHGPHFLQTLAFHEPDRSLDIVLPDLRSDRTQKQVLSGAQWADLNGTLAGLAAPSDSVKRHLLVVSSIPVVHMTFHVSEWLLRVLPGRQEIEDDLRDQWESTAHRGERDRLAMTLLGHAAAARCATTILSGDVHIGARGRIRSRRPGHLWDGRPETWIDQVTSSAVVHPPPSGAEMALLRLVGGEGASVIANGVDSELLPVTPSARYLTRRNWLLGGFDGPGSSCRAWLQWQTEDGPVEPQVVVEA